MCRENSRFIDSWQEWVFYMETYVHLLQYLAELFSEWEDFQTKVTETVKTLLC
jgi:hypothetical protein